MSADFKKNSNLLVHTCCAPCASSVFEKLISEGYKTSGFFYNPNIYPENEYKTRLNELISFSGKKNYKIIIMKSSYDQWLKAVEGFEDEKEGGERCKICFQIRLEETALYALNNDFDCFTTVLTVSPYKNTKVINEIGKSLEEKYGIYFLEADFKKNDGYKRSLEISREYNLYRQKYCGCEFSVNKIKRED